ncbi:ABC transporter permease [Aurantibacillus circumpalustris]|uniref:ABC transporter permease n=1 Tax=Aurantibacillus circumpalustris TaxID=3036359 RepID=UPI00295A9774|nr:ABC transporter permease [Aurantibacillus circumpalustris]
MILNYFKTAYRNLVRNKSYAIINISGLAIGIAACLLIFLVVRYELSYDKFRIDYSNIYHIYTQNKHSDGLTYNPGVPYPMVDALRSEFPQIKSGVICTSYGNQITIDAGSSSAKKFIEESGTCFADPDFFDVIKFNWLIGAPKVLSDPNKVVLSKSIATKYFSDWQTCIGKTLKLDNRLDLQVGGIVEDVPFNSDFRFQLIGSYITIKNNNTYGYTSDWGSNSSNNQVFMLFPEKVSEAAIEKQLEAFSKKYHKDNGKSETLNLLRPLKDIHHDRVLGNFGTHITTHSTLVTLSFIGFLIIIMACINFINLSTAQSVGRSKEVGIRKVLGSNRKQLFWQMLGETKVMVLFSSFIAIGLAWLFLPYIKYVITIDEELSLFTVQSILFFISTLVVVTVLAGIYPAVVLSGFKPVVALKNKINSANIGGISLRRSLVVIQFAISQVLIIGTIVAISQMNFINSIDLGFNKEAILLLQGSTDSVSISKHKVFKEELLKMPEVKDVSFASDMPSSDNNLGTNFAIDHHSDEDFTLYLKFGDEDYFKTFGLQFIAGRSYSEGDTITEVVVNETFLKKLNITNADVAIGKEIRTGGNPWRKICGVVKDFKTNSLREEIRPIMISAFRKRYQVVSVKLSSQNLAQTQKTIQSSWDKFFPDYVYVSNFMDEHIEKFYEQERQMALLYKIFAGLAIFISCLGLYGLISFMVVQKTKEVGIRKVLGAGISSIFYLFSREFAALIVVAFLIAAPLAYYFMSAWLNNFVFRVTMGVGVFIVAVTTSLLIAFLAVGYKAYRAAVANPVKSLRAE